MKGPIARISVNGVEVGSLPADTYQLIVSTVRGQRWLYLVYVARALRSVACLFVKATRLIPLLIILGVAIIAMIEPDATSAFIEFTRSAAPDEIAASLQACMTFFMLPIYVLVMWGLMMINPSRSLPASPFSEEVERRIMRLLEVPTMGLMTVVLTGQAMAGE